MRSFLIKSGFRDKSVAALFGMDWNLKNNRSIVFKQNKFFRTYSIRYTVCNEGALPGLVLIKSGFTNRKLAALFSMNWQMRNNKPISFVEENFVSFKLYSVYYAVCKAPVKPGEIAPIGG